MGDFLRGFWRLHSTKVIAGGTIVISMVLAACILVAVCVIGWFWVTGFVELVMYGVSTPAWEDQASLAQWTEWVILYAFTWLFGAAFYLLLVVTMTGGRKDMERKIRESMKKAASFYRNCKQAGLATKAHKEKN